MNRIGICFLIFIPLLLGSCKVYRQNIILQTDEDLQTEAFDKAVESAEQAYEIKANDFIFVEVYTNNGELVIDPNLELQSLNMQGGRGGMQNIPDKNFQVFANGQVDLPIIGEVRAAGYTILDFQTFLEKKYAEIYIDPFVRVRSLNRRAVVLGAVGGVVVPLENEKMNLLEVLALAGGLPRDSKGGNIRLIRGPLDNPAVQVIDLSTIEGMQKANLFIEPNDIIYVEPVRRIFNESIRDAAPIIGLVSNVVTLLVVLNVINVN